MSPVALMALVGILLAIIGAALYWAQRFYIFKDFREIAEDAGRIAEALKSEVTRDAGDLLIAGSYGRFPTLVRLSHNLNMPGMHIQMRAPASFSFSLTPKKITPPSGRLAMRTGSDVLDSKFVARTSDPAHARMLVSSRPVLSSLEKLCCSTQTDFALKTGTMELSELSIPEYPSRHVLDHLQAMETVGKMLLSFPGADTIKIEPVGKRRTSWTIRIALGVGLIAVVALLFLQPGSHSKPAAGPAVETVSPSGMPAADATRFGDLAGWHVAQAADFSGDARRFFEDHGLTASGRLSIDFSGAGTLDDTAYLLVNARGQRRVSLLVGGGLRYDSIFPRAALIARIPKDEVPNIHWAIPPQFGADGDGLLVVEDLGDPAASLVLLRHGSQTYSGRPADFTRVDVDFASPEP